MNFPREKSQYVLSTPGDLTPDGGTMHKAKHVNPATQEEVDVQIKIIDVDKLEDIFAFTSQFCKTRNAFVKVHCSFIAGQQLWVVMSPPKVPIRSIIKSDFQQGLPEKAICFVLKETLKSVHYMHEVKNRVCKNIGAGCVYLDTNYGVTMPMSSRIFEDRANSNVMNSGFIKDYKLAESKETDILMFGFLALELFYGAIPSSEEYSLLVANEFGLKHNKLDKLWSFACFHGAARELPPTALAEVMAACLCREPAGRPTTTKLMKFKLFQTKFQGKRILEKLMNKKPNR